MNLRDYVWVSTRTKALLTTKDRATLTELRAVYSGQMSADPHLVAIIDSLLTP